MMATFGNDSSPSSLDLPPEFADLDGLLRTDIHAIVAMLTQRAQERLLLTRRESRALQTNLLNSLTEAVNGALEPLTVEAR